MWVSPDRCFTHINSCVLVPETEAQRQEAKLLQGQSSGKKKS